MINDRKIEKKIFLVIFHNFWCVGHIGFYAFELLTLNFSRNSKIVFYMFKVLILHPLEPLPKQFQHITLIPPISTIFEEIKKSSVFIIFGYFFAIFHVFWQKSIFNFVKLILNYVFWIQHKIPLLLSIHMYIFEQKSKNLEFFRPRFYQKRAWPFWEPSWDFQKVGID